MNPQLPIDGDGDAGLRAVNDQPVLCVSRNFFGKYGEILYHASYKSARHWCDKEAKTHGLSWMAVFEHYLHRLSQRGWGRFSVIEADAANGSADIRLDYSAFLLAQGEACAAKTCYRFAGWFAGVMDWISENGGRPVKTLCCETQCGADGHDHCVFAVRPWATRRIPL